MSNTQNLLSPPGESNNPQCHIVYNELHLTNIPYITINFDPSCNSNLPLHPSFNKNDITPSTI